MKPFTKLQAFSKCSSSPRFVLAALLLFGAVASQSGCNIASSGSCLQGKRWFDQGNYNQALTSFQKSLTQNPRNPDPYYNIGAVYHRLAKQTQNAQYLPQAENYYRQAISLNDQHTDAHRALAVLLIETNRQAQGFDLIRTWQTRHPESSEPNIELARLHQEYGDQQRAVQYLADALSIDGNNARAHKALGMIREQQGQYSLALDNFVRSYQANNLQPDVASRIANLQTRLQTATLPQLQPTNRQGSLIQPGTANQFVPH